MTSGRIVRVLVVDDSATIRRTLADILSEDEHIEVIGTAADPFAAARIMREAVPDVIVLDVEMPRMDGITFLQRLMEQHPLPVVMCATHAGEGSRSAMLALEAGAVDVIMKPEADARRHLIEQKMRVCDAVRAAAQAHVHRLPRRKGFGTVPKKLSADVIIPAPSARKTIRATEKVVCIGASTGGTDSLRVVLQMLPAGCPGIVVVQHMPENFTQTFARRLNDLCTVTVKEAEDGDPVLPGQVLIAPGNHHLLLKRNGTRYCVAIKDGPLVCRHRPSVDVLFRSAAQYAGANATGIIMTGMGDDGARGLLEMRQAGAHTVAQDEASCVVFGMPREAIERGAADRILPLEALAHEIMKANA